MTRGTRTRSSVLRLPGQGTVVLHRRSVAVTAALLVLAGAVTVVAVSVGNYDLGLRGVIDTIGGGGSATDRFIVLRQRLPRAAAALAVGAALGLSGAIFQSMSRNPLGSPDIIGFTTGASTGGLVAILLTAAPSTLSVTVGTLIGGFATAFAVILITVRRGVGGERLILAGIAVGAMLASVNDYLISRAPLESAEAAKAWQFGSLNAIGWNQVTPLLIATAVLLPAVFGIARPARILELGDDAAAGLGVRVRRQRVMMAGLGVALAATAVATAGPIGFLALAAPQLARKLACTPGIAFAPSIAMGALILASADVLAQRLLSPFQIPVGLVSAALGGVYLMWLLGFSRD